MNTTTDKNELRKIYSEVQEPAVKKLMQAIYGKETFIQKITDRVKTFEDALEASGYTLASFDKEVLDYTGGDKQMKSTQAHLKLSIIAKALNEGWTPDFTNSEYKYHPWFKYAPGVGFSYGGYGRDYSATGVGSRLCYKSRELAEYAAKQFQDIYNDFLN